MSDAGVPLTRPGQIEQYFSQYPLSTLNQDRFGRTASAHRLVNVSNTGGGAPDHLRPQERYSPVIERGTVTSPKLGSLASCRCQPAFGALHRRYGTWQNVDSVNSRTKGPMVVMETEFVEASRMRYMNP